MSDSQTQDLLGNPLSPDERELLEIYRRLEQLSSREDLAPSTLMNTRQALVMLWNACTDLGILYEEPSHD